jgi:hypothetical protein
MAQGNNAKREGARSNELYQLQALNRIKDSITGPGLPPSPTGIATEATLQAVLTAVDSMRDYEVRLVEDSDTPVVTWLEVRYWDAQDGTLGAPAYHLPGDNTAYAVGDPGGPVAPLTYVPTSSLLSQIVAELQAVNLELDAIKIDTESIEINTDNLDVALSTRATEATLAAVNAKLNSLGQKASAASVPVVLSSEQEAFIDGLETLLTTIDAVLDDIKLDTGALVVDLAAIEVLQTSILSALTTIDGVLDNILLDTNAMVVDLAAIEILITTTNSLLTTIDGVIDQIQTNTLNTVNELTTANVSLNNIYNELLDQGSSLDALVIDAAAIEAELLDQGLSLDALVVDLAAIEVELLDQGTTLDAILVDTGQIETELLDQGVSLDALVVDAAAIEAELLDQGLTLDSVKTELESVDDRLTAKTVTPNLVRATAAGTIAPAVYSFSIANVGAADGSITIGANPAVAIKPTESLTFDAGSLNNQYAAGTIAYDGSGTELVIIFNS